LSIEDQIKASGLDSIYEKVMKGERLSFDDGVRLFETPDLLSVGRLANIIRERKNGDFAYYNRNQHINYTNICNKGCRFCAFQRLPNAADAYWLSLEDVEEKLRKFRDIPITEVHMVAGINPKIPYSYYLDLLRTVKSVRPEVHIKAFTMIEVEEIVRVSGKSSEETLLELREAGLGSFPGGGAEVFSERVHKELFRRKLDSQRWLELAKAAHALGFRSNATMLYGHVESDAERVEHLIKLRETQDQSGGFQTFIPLAFHPENTELDHLPSTTGMMDLRTVAVARLMLDNFPHIKAFWIMVSPRVAQIALSFGADDIDGTVLEEHITHDAGATTPQGLTQKEMIRLIREAGRIPVERDTLYNVVSMN